MSEQKTYIIRIRVKSRRFKKAEIKDMIKGILLDSAILRNYVQFKILNGESKNAD